MNLGKWADLKGLTMAQVTKHGLVKGVAMSEGTTNRGEIFTLDNLKGAVGGLRAAAKLRKTRININHNSDNVGRILDAEISVNHVDGKEIGQVEFIAKVNPDTFQKIQQGSINGCSVEDSPRVCHSKACTYEGSTFLNMALVTSDQKPNSLHTWIEPITQQDITPDTHTLIHHLENDPEIEKPIRVSGDLKKTETESKQETEKTEPVKETETEKTEPTMQEMFDSMAKKIDDRFNELKQQYTITAHNYNQLEINRLEQDVKNSAYAITPDQHAKYTALKDKLDGLKKKTLKTYPH